MFIKATVKLETAATDCFKNVINLALKQCEGARVVSWILAANAELMESLMTKNKKSIPEAAAYEYYQEVDLMNSFQNRGNNFIFRKTINISEFISRHGWIPNSFV